MLRVTRLLRVLRAGGNAREILDKLIAKFQIKAAYIEIIRFVMGILLAVHILSCIFHIVGQLQQGSDRAGSQWQQGTWHALAVGESSVILMTPPVLSRLKRLIKAQGGAIK